MIHFRLRIDVSNLRVRLSRGTGRLVGETEAVAWLAQKGITRRLPPTRQEFLASEQTLEILEPWEILERHPLINLPEPVPEHALARQ